MRDALPSPLLFKDWGADAAAGVAGSTIYMLKNVHTYILRHMGFVALVELYSSMRRYCSSN